MDLTKKILLAGNQWAGCNDLRNILNNEYSVIEVEDGNAALQALASSNSNVDIIIIDLEIANPDVFSVLEAIKKEPLVSKIPILAVASFLDAEKSARALKFGAVDILVSPLEINSQVVLQRIKNILIYTESKNNTEGIDSLTGLCNRHSFYNKVREVLNTDKDTKYSIIQCDIDHFKLFNDIYGTKAGDEFLVEFAKSLRAFCYKDTLIAHFDSDHFVMFARSEYSNLDCTELKHLVDKWFIFKKFNFDFIPRIGIYNIHDPSVDVALMCDRAYLALKSIKYKFNQQYMIYESYMRDSLVVEQEITGEMVAALKDNQFEVYYQPQYNYTQKSMSGAEALVRWKHPVKGMIMPSLFIPVFEKNGFISELDYFVWEETCKRIRYQFDNSDKFALVPISVNISRADLYRKDLCERLDSLVKKYKIDPSYLRLEITESSYMAHPQELIELLKTLHTYGFIVEMDDFGSGYSSLNTLKDLPVDVLKMDMKFLDDNQNTDRGGLILESIVRMAHWLNLPVIAEGVETRVQADYLNSIGCHLMQGYYFSKPIPADDFQILLSNASVQKEQNFIKNTDIINMVEFLDPKTQTALAFNGFVGAAIVFEYREGSIDVVRVNDKYYTETKITPEEFDKIGMDILSRYTNESREQFISTIKEAIKTGKEQEFELKTIDIHNKDNLLVIRNRMRLLAHAFNRYVFFDALENVTEKRLLEKKVAENIERNNIIFENMNVVIFDFDLTKDILEYVIYSQSHTPKRVYIKEYSKYLPNAKLLHSDGIKKIKNDLLNIEHIAKNRSFECLMSLYSVDYSPVRVNYTCLTDMYGKTNRVVGRVDDIRKEKALEQRYNDEKSVHKALGADIVQYFRFNITTNIIEETKSTAIPKKASFMFLKPLFPDEKTWIGITKTFSAKNLMRQYLKGNNKFEKRYCCFLSPKRKELKWVLCTVVMTQKPCSGDVVAFIYIRDINDEVVMQRVLDKTVHYDYEYIIIIDTKINTARRISQKKTDTDFWPDTTNDYESLITEMALDRICEEDASTVIASCKTDNILAKLKNKERYKISYTLKPEYGSARKQVVFALLDEDRQSVLCTRIDVTSDYDQQALLRRQKNILVAIPCGIALYEVRDGTLYNVYMSESMLGVLGYTDSKNEFDSQDLLATVYDDDIPIVEQAIDNVVKGINYKEHEYRRVTKSGEVIWVNVRINIVESGNSLPLVYAVYTNVTQRHLYEKERFVATERLEVIVNNLGCGVSATFVENGKASFIFANDRFYALMGYPKEHYNNLKSYLEIIHPDDRTEIINKVSESLIHNGTIKIEYRVMREDGTITWIRSIIARTALAGYSSPIELSTYTNISDEKDSYRQLCLLNEISSKLLAQPNAEKAIDVTLNAILKHFKGNRAYVFEFNDDFTVTDNTYEVCAENVEPEKDKLQKLPLSEFPFWIHAFDNTKYVNIDVKNLDGERAEERKILEMQNIESMVAAPLMRDGKYIGFVGVDDPCQHGLQLDYLTSLGDYIAVLLTRRDLLNTIRHEKESISAIVNGIPGGFVRMQLFDDGSIVPLYCSDGFSKLVNMNKKQLANIYKKNVMFGIFPDDKTIACNAVKRMRQGEEISGLKFRMITGNGEYKWVDVSGKTQCSDDGNVYLNVYYTDATSQKKAEETILWRNARLKILTEGLKTTIFDYDVENDTITYQVGNTEKSVDKYLADAVNKSIVVHPDDLQGYKDTLVDACRQPKVGSYVYRGNYFDPNYSLCKANYVSVSDETGKVIRVVGCVDDIHDEDTKK